MIYSIPQTLLLQDFMKQLWQPGIGSMQTLQLKWQTFWSGFRQNLRYTQNWTGPGSAVSTGLSGITGEVLPTSDGEHGVLKAAGPIVGLPQLSPCTHPAQDYTNLLRKIAFHISCRSY